MRSTGGGTSHTGTRYQEPHSHSYPRSFLFVRRDGTGTWCAIDWEGGPDGHASASGRSGTGSSLCLGRDRTRMGSRERFPAVSRPGHTGTGSSWCACPGSFPERDICYPSVPVSTRDGVFAIPLLWYRTETRSPPSLCPSTGLDGVPAVRLSWYWSGMGSPVSLCSATGRDELCPCSHHPRITPVLHPPIFSSATPALSVPAPGGDYPGGSESSAFGCIPPASLSRGTPNPRI